MKRTQRASAWKWGLRILQSGVIRSLLRLHKMQLFSDQYGDARIHRQAKQTGKKLYALCLRLGPSAVKLGQMLSTRHDLFPPSLIHELERLQDQVEPLPFSMIEQRLKEAWGEEHYADFSRIDPQPIASASIAQVHRGILDGREICIKVQRPGVREQMLLDLQMWERWFHRMTRFIPLEFYTEVEEVFRAFHRQVEEETDFRREAKNLENFQRFHQKDRYVHVPTPNLRYTTSQVLVMDYFSAPSIRLQAPFLTLEERREMANRLLFSFCNQIFRDGFFHGDPHPGNLLLERDGQIVLLDFGIVGRLSPKNKYAFLTLFLGVTKNAPRIVMDAMQQMHMYTGTVNRALLQRDIQRLLDRYLTMTLAELDLAEMIHSFFQLLREYHLRIPADLTMLARAMMILEGVVESMHLDQNILELAQPIAKKLVHHYISRDYFREFVLPGIYDGYCFLRDLPSRLLDRLYTSPTVGQREIQPIQKERIFYLEKIAFWRWLAGLSFVSVLAVGLSAMVWVKRSLPFLGPIILTAGVIFLWSVHRQHVWIQRIKEKER